MKALALVVLFLAVADPGDADLWPQWRGPTGDSIAPTPLPTHWSQTENVVWKSALPGWGNSTPAIWNDAIFLTAQVDDERLILMRVDRKSGKLEWQRDVGSGTPRRKGPVGEGRFHDENNMASPSPVTDGTHVWVHFGNGDLACYDYAGMKVWALNLRERFGPYSIWWGHANSPALVGDLLVSVCMQDPKGSGQSYVVAHDKTTGKERWHALRDTGTTKEQGATPEWADAYTTPLVRRHAKGTELIIYGANLLNAYDAASGKELWRAAPFKGNRVISGPTLAGDTVYAVQGMKGPLFAVKTGTQGDVTASNVLWKYAGSTPDAASPTIANGLVFLATNAGTAVCIDAVTGTELWKERLGDTFRASPLVAGGKVYFFSKEGKATVVEASRQFQIVSTADLGEQIIASPAAAQGDLYIRTKGQLYRIGAR
jgi:outer membrane protein assembly factor BamB